MIDVQHLSRVYGRNRVVDDISFTGRPGRVTGFLGPNGAGKSTSMRVLVGLTPPTSGTATVLGCRFADLPNPGREVGVLLDASAQHAGRTGRDTLRIAQRTMGLPARRVEETLAQVGLTDQEADRRVRGYSLGMRQRLGIGNALIGDPEVLILDEPANGLDPAGIRWMRDLLRGFADRGGTVLLSSHLLHEIEVVADDLVVIGRGRIVAAGSKDELLAGAGTLVRVGRTTAGTTTGTTTGTPTGTTTSPDDRHATTLAGALADRGLSSQALGEGGLRVDADAETVGAVAFAAGVPLRELRPADSAGLEEMFLQLTAHDSREGAAA